MKAITVTEDRAFFEHYGVNVRGIMRALVRRYDSDPNSPIARQGGSSITQQLVKNLLLSPEKTLKRKVAEAYMSVILETRLSKASRSLSSTAIRFTWASRQAFRSMVLAKRPTPTSTRTSPR